MQEPMTQVRIRTKTLNEYRLWAKITGRNITDLVEIALKFGLRKQSEVEREVVQQLEK